MATDALHSSSGAWPQVGNPPPTNTMSPTDPNPEWEMIADEDNNNSNSINSSNNDDHVVILPADIGSSIERNKSIKGRPRSATMGGQTPLAFKNQHDNTTPATAPNSPTKNPGDTSIASSDVSSRTKHRKLRRCASTPDLLMSDNAHEVIVEDESDESTTSSSQEEENDDEEKCDVYRDLNENLGGESFEVLSDDNQDDNNSEPVMIDEDSDSAVHRCDEESATLVSTPSMDTSAAWTMTSEVPPMTTSSTTPSVWGMKKSPSFAEMLAKNINNDANNGSGGLGTGGGWGSDKAKTESMLRDSHRKHHLRVKTKPKFIVTEDVGGGGKTMKHAHSTGDLTKMLVGPEQERTRMFGQGRNRMTRKQLSDLMEEDDEGDFIIGRGSGSGGGGGGGGTSNEGDIMGDTDAMDFYHRKEKGSKGTSNKKKIRPDEAKRKEISMHKKEMQRQKQAESQKSGGGGGGGKATPRKKKNEKGFGGKKERRRL